MPKFNTTTTSPTGAADMEQFALKTSHYGFSGTRIEDLGASEYTLCTIVQDDSSSVEYYKMEMEKTIKKIVEACLKSPRADNLMIRFCKFANAFTEVHGFKRLQTIKQTDYDGVLGGGGMTALFDASENAIAATNMYGKKLTENDFSTNGIVFIVTDGMDNVSKLLPKHVRAALQDATKKEYLESLVSILVGVNPSNEAMLDDYLNRFHQEAGITQYVNIGEASPNKLARLAEFVSKSISQQSQALGTGGPSQSLAF